MPINRELGLASVRQFLFTLENLFVEVTRELRFRDSASLGEMSR